MFSKTELIEKGKHYFDNKDVEVMYATPDGNFFYQNSKSYADSHAKSKKEPDFKVIEITRADLNVKPKSDKTSQKPKDTKEVLELDQLRKEAKGLKIRGYAIMKEPALKKKIAEANAS